MSGGSVSAGVALLCDEHGLIESVMRDEIGLDERLATGQTLYDMADRASGEKITNFLAELTSEQAAFDWEINVPVHGKLVTLQFGGSRTDPGRYMVVAAHSQRAAQRLYEDLLQMGNEQTNALRAAMADKSRLERKLDDFNSVYEQLSAVNNELVGLQRQLHKQNAELVRLSQEKDRFVGMAAHDLRSPLGIVHIYADLLFSDIGEGLGEDHKDILWTIRDQSAKMLAMVEDLLDIARIESGTVRLNLEKVDPTQLIQRNVQRNRLLAAAKQIELKVHCEPDLPMIRADAGKIDQILNNLISNAIKYSQSETETTVTATFAQHGANSVPGPALSITVKDQGIGIAPSEQALIFQPFGRTSNQTTGGESSTGLGLSIVKKMIESHRGEISVESASGVGTTFLVILPLDPDNVPPGP
jgi:signal transduction histidine kinase